MNSITALDLEPWDWRSYVEELSWSNVEWVFADGTAMPFPDDSFDVVFLSSVLEHLHPDRWQAYAAEIRRVANRYYVQTPNKLSARTALPASVRPVPAVGSAAARGLDEPR